MTDLISFFPSGTKLLDLLFDYNRLPIRIIDDRFCVKYSSFDVEAFWKTDFHDGVYGPLFSSEKEVALCCVNSLELMACFSFRHDGNDYRLIVGPALLVRPYSAESVQALRFFPPLKKEDLEMLISTFPVVNIRQFAGFVRLLYTAFSGKEITARELIERSTEVSTPNNISRALSDSVFEQRENAANHTSYAQESLLLNAIKAGDLKGLEYLSGSILPQNNFQLSTNPLRQSIYQFISSLTMITRFAVEGGLDEELAFNMCEVYIQKVDRCKTSLEVASLLYTAATDFTTRVHSTRNKGNYSGYTVLCIDYIFRHLHDSITLQELSKEVGLTPAYLSVLFKKETGLPLSDFIQVQRIEEAKNLLRFSEYRISEISNHLAFNSQSYFTSVFKRHIGMTPKKYRDTYYRKNW